MSSPSTVQLDETEKALYDSICWGLDALLRMEREEQHEQLERMGKLAESLIQRNAVPKVRMRCFTDSSMNIGGHGKSRKDIFERNGTQGTAILRHHDFMAHLRYFINGPDLPKPTILGFCQIIEEDAGTSGMVLDQLKSYVKKEVRNRGMEPSYAAEEFFKLAHEIGSPELAENGRSAARCVRA